MKVMTEVTEFENFLEHAEIEKLLAVAQSSTEEQWTVFNEPELNGQWWNGKRLMIDSNLTTNLSKGLSEVFDNQYMLTASNKLQRFFKGDVLGPLADGVHVPSIAYGCILFLQDGEDDGIVFPHLGRTVKAQANKLVVYPADFEYAIAGPTNADVRYFITVFFNKRP
jgi:hypothetical protein